MTHVIGHVNTDCSLSQWKYVFMWNWNASSLIEEISVLKWRSEFSTQISRQPLLLQATMKHHYQDPVISVSGEGFTFDEQDKPTLPLQS